ncbi:nuclear transport factor 2 family protein [Novosphingobium sp. ERN07]|uniref:nuclear transport factor 2 family protein n=1 Tax=Novosphingobium sp. ERN07 TaxID=2726187 RepID=UPI0014573D5F|nr:nuclear transport factor 2 family protein [Novosphingobium sp. ERN07]NLR73194.1 nuclear transport factor 2 family protein [Novosphingobium sp. ERN07]
MDPELRTLLDKQACTELVFRFARGLDRCDEDIIRSVFHPDATDDHGQFKGSAEEFISWVLPLLATMERTQHVIGNVLVDVSGDEAWAESYFVAYHDVTSGDGSLLRTTIAGRYFDTFARRAGQWRIAHREFVSDWSAAEPRSDNWDRVTPGSRQFGARGAEDPLYRYITNANRSPVAA